MTDSKTAKKIEVCPCICGHDRSKHDIEQPYECLVTDANDACQCDGFEYPKLSATELVEPSARPPESEVILNFISQNRHLPDCADECHGKCAQRIAQSFFDDGLAMKHDWEKLLDEVLEVHNAAATELVEPSARPQRCEVIRANDSENKQCTLNQGHTGRHDWLAALFNCVECGSVYAFRMMRCLVCEHGPENSQPTMVEVPSGLVHWDVNLREWKSGGAGKGEDNG